MPSIRKRIGYLPSVNIQEIITNIAIKEKLSQSKVVDILVEEALKARGLFDFKNTNDLFREKLYSDTIKINNSSLKYNDIDELISDEGISYNAKKFKLNSDTISSKEKEAYNQELLEQFKQFIQYQNKIQ